MDLSVKFTPGPFISDKQTQKPLNRGPHVSKTWYGQFLAKGIFRAPSQFEPRTTQLLAV